MRIAADNSKIKRRIALMPQPRLMTRAEAMDFLRPQLFRDAVAAGWLQPCAEKPNAHDEGSKLYAVADVQAVEDRVLRREYPLGGSEKGKVKSEKGGAS